MIERLHTLGYMNVYNKKENFYDMIHRNQVPSYDVLITNPPYSMDHMEQLLCFVTKSSKPWFLLLPNYVYCKDYYQHHINYSTCRSHETNASTTITSNTDKTTNTIITTNNSRYVGSHSSIVKNGMFYVTPVKGRRYLYTTPKGRRQEKSSKYTSPFPTFWYCYLPNKALLSRLLSIQKKDDKVNVAHSIAMIPIEVIVDDEVMMMRMLMITTPDGANYVK